MFHPQLRLWRVSGVLCCDAENHWKICFLSCSRRNWKSRAFSLRAKNLIRNDEKRLLLKSTTWCNTSVHRANAYCEMCSSVMNVLQEQHHHHNHHHFRHQFKRFEERKINQTGQLPTKKVMGWRLYRTNIEPEIGPSQLILFLGEVEHNGGGGDTVRSKWSIIISRQRLSF